MTITDTIKPDETPKSGSDRSHTKEPGETLELVTFLIGEQPFCIDIMALREIRGWSRASEIPDAPDFVLGVINLRGTVLPIFDLSQRLKGVPLVPGDRTVVMVTQIGERLVGLLADAVSDIIAVSQADVKPLPDIARDPEHDFVRGLIARDDMLISLLCTEAVVPVLPTAPLLNAA